MHQLPTMPLPISIVPHLLVNTPYLFNFLESHVCIFRFLLNNALSFTGQASSSRYAQAIVQGNISLFPVHHTARISQYLFLCFHLLKFSIGFNGIN